MSEDESATSGGLSTNMISFSSRLVPLIEYYRNKRGYFQQENMQPMKYTVGTYVWCVLLILLCCFVIFKLFYKT